MTHLEAILIHQCILCYINCFPLYYLIFLATTCDRTSGRDSSKIHQSIRRIRSLSYLFVSFLRNSSFSKSGIQFFKNAIVSDIILNGVKVSSTIFPHESASYKTVHSAKITLSSFLRITRSPLHYLSQLNNLSGQMINLMLTNLCRPSGQFLALFFPVEVIILYFYFLISGRLTDTIQGQTTFFRLIHIML